MTPDSPPRSYRALWRGPTIAPPPATPGTARRIEHPSVRPALRPWRFRPDGGGDRYMRERSDLELGEPE